MKYKNFYSTLLITEGKLGNYHEVPFFSTMDTMPSSAMYHKTVSYNGEIDVELKKRKNGLKWYQVRFLYAHESNSCYVWTAGRYIHADIADHIWDKNIDRSMKLVRGRASMFVLPDGTKHPAVAFEGGITREPDDGYPMYGPAVSNAQTAFTKVASALFLNFPPTTYIPAQKIMTTPEAAELINQYNITAYML